MTHSLDRARATLEAVDAAQQALVDEYDKPDAQRSSRTVAGLHESIRYGLKAAEAHALVSIADDAQSVVELLGELLERLAPDVERIELDGPLLERLERERLSPAFQDAIKVNEG